MAIGIKAQGRTGNRMFQFAFGYCLSKKLNTVFFIERIQDLSWFETYTTYYLKNKIVFSLVKLRHILKTLFYAQTESSYQSLHVTRIDDWADYKDIDSRLTNNTFYIGYFQSINFFDSCISELKKIFTVKQSFQNKFVLSKSN